VSVSDILTTALTGLGAAQAGMRTVSNNITNVNTPGYARERVSLQPGVLGGQVSGVVVGEPERVVDRYLEGAVYGRAGDAARSETIATYLDRLQSYLGATGAESGMSARLDAITSTATALTGASAGTQANSAFVGEVVDAIDSLQQLAGDAAGLRADVDSEVGASVTRINSLLVSISDLNDSIASLTGLARSTAGPEDQRAAAIQELSGLVGITTRLNPDGRVEIDTTSGTPLLDQRLRQLSRMAASACRSPSIHRSSCASRTSRAGWAPPPGKRSTAPRRAASSVGCSTSAIARSRPSASGWERCMAVWRRPSTPPRTPAPRCPHPRA
jgi:flagellar hook-associated protein 1 FlgK